MNLSKVALFGAGFCVGALGLGVLVVAKIIEDCAKRNGWA